MQHITPEVAASLLPLFEPFAARSAADGGAPRPAAALQQMAGYDDFNFRVVDAASGCSYVLKIHNAADSATGGVAFEAQSAAMEHAAASGRVRSNRPVPLAGGSGCVATAEIGGSRHAVRLLTFVEGDIMGPRPLEPGLQRALGAYVARLSEALLGFSHPGLCDQSGDWVMECASSIARRKLQLAGGFSGQQRQMILDAAARFDSAVERYGARLPRQVCHSDVNENNVLVSGDRSMVTGVLDWGDAAHCWRVVELAVAVTYAMLLAEAPEAGGGTSAGSSEAGGGTAGEAGGAVEGADEPLRAGASVVAGYLAAGGELAPEERAMLAPLICARVAVSLVNGACAAAANPGNSGYLLATQRPGWALLARLLALEESEAVAALAPAREEAARGGGAGATAARGPALVTAG